MKTLTLAFPLKDGQILLGLKKRGFGMGKWNGFGGKLEEGESVEAAAKRELLEESGIESKTLEPRGVLLFRYKHTGDELEVFVFAVTEFTGEPVDTEEMNPRWFSTEQFPYNQSWPDDQYWMPLFLAGKRFRGEFVFTDYDTIASHEVTSLSRP